MFTRLDPGEVSATIARNIVWVLVEPFSTLREPVVEEAVLVDVFYRRELARVGSDNAVRLAITVAHEGIGPTRPQIRHVRPASAPYDKYRRYYDSIGALLDAWYDFVMVADQDSRGSLISVVEGAKRIIDNQATGFRRIEKNQADALELVRSTRARLLGKEWTR